MPCRVATTANITLSGTQTIDGVAVVADDRVLVKNQTTASQNGIYQATTSTWQRTLDFDGAFDVVEGTLVPVNNGTTNADTVWRVTTTGTITPGTTSLAFEVATSLKASDVTFTQSGSGAVAGDVQEELRYFIRPEQFGAVGDNSTDDKAAFDLALVAAANRILYITKPHKINSNITFPSTITLLFDRQGAINPATGVTVTMNSDIHSVRKVADTFGGAGTVTIAATAHRIFKDQFVFASTPAARGCAIGTGTGEGPQFDVQLYMTGDWTTTGLPHAVGFQMDTQLTPRDVNTVIRGMQLSPGLKTKASGNHPDVVGLRVEPSVTGNGAAIANYASIHIPTLSLPAAAAEGAALLLQAPTGAVVNYAIDVVAGNSRLRGDLDVGVVSGNTLLTLGSNSAGNDASYLSFLSSVSAINWRIEHNSSIAGGLEFAPSTAGGGATFGTPVLSLSSDGAGVNISASSTTALIVAASATGKSSLRIPHGTAPSSPVNGDMWTTSTGLFVRIDGATVGPLS